MKFLIVEDHIATAQMISMACSMRWPESEMLAVETGEQALRSIESGVDLVLLDLGLPDFLGIEVISRTREFSDVPIIVITGTDDESAIVRTLELGADDHIAKPFQSLELLARVQSVLRRSRQTRRTGATLHKFGDMIADLTAGEVLKAGVKIRLTVSETRILEALMSKAPQVVGYGSIGAAMGGGTRVSDGDIRSIQVHIRNLRLKIEDDANLPRYIENLPGVGYRFTATPVPVEFEPTAFAQGSRPLAGATAG